MFYDDNSIQIDFMTKAYQHLLNGAQAQAMEESDPFNAVLARKAAKAGKAAMAERNAMGDIAALAGTRTLSGAFRVTMSST